MRLTPEQVRAAILHADQAVRDEAVAYFVDSLDATTEILPLAIQAIERYGWDEAFTVYRFLEALPQTEDTLAWILAQLAAEPQSTLDRGFDLSEHLWNAIWRAHPELLKHHQQALRQLWAENSPEGEALGERLWFHEQPVEWLWGELEACCQSEAEQDFLGDEEEYAERLVRALAEHPQALSARVVSLLANCAAGYPDEVRPWMELRLAQLARCTVFQRNWQCELGH